MDALTQKLIGTPEVLDDKTKSLGDFDKWIGIIQKNSIPNPACIDTFIKLTILFKMGVVFDKEESIKESLRAQETHYPYIPVNKNFNDLRTLLSKGMMDAKVELMTLYASSVMAHTPEQVLVVAYMLKWIYMNGDKDKEVMPIDVLKSFPKGIPGYRDLDSAWKVSPQIVDLKKVTEYM